MKIDIPTFVAAVSDRFYDVPQGKFTSGSLDTILNIVFGVMGAIALIVLLLASLKYVTSRGEPTEVAKAKNAILYAVIGLVVVASAFTIVSFVVDKV